MRKLLDCSLFFLSGVIRCTPLQSIWVSNLNFECTSLIIASYEGLIAWVECALRSTRHTVGCLSVCILIEHQVFSRIYSVYNPDGENGVCLWKMPHLQSTHSHTQKTGSKTHWVAMAATLHDTCDKYTVGWIMSRNKRLQSSVPSVFFHPPMLL